MNQVDPCNVHAKGCIVEPPTVDCVLTDWNSWSSCSNSCGTGQQMRIRSVLTASQGKGRGCSGSLKDVAPCSNPACTDDNLKPISCQWGDWNAWGSCTKCSGQKHRYRNIKQHAQHGGEPCDVGASFETAGCERECHKPKSCAWSDWGAWAKCSTTCGPGVRKRSRALVASEVTELDDVGMAPQLQQRLHAVRSHRVQDLVLSFVGGFLTLVVLFGSARLVRSTKAARTWGMESEPLTGTAESRVSITSETE